MGHYLKTLGGWVVTALLWLWFILPKLIDFIGKTTLPEDWQSLMVEKLPAGAAWLFSTPWWVPASLATLLTIWLMWVSRPRQTSPKNEGDPLQLVAKKNAQSAQFFPVPEVVTYGEKGIYVGRMQLKPIG